MTENRLAADLDHVLDHTRELWEELRGERIFITGGTGFFGCWLLESFAWAHQRLGLNASATVLTRNPDAFFKKMPHLVENPALHFFEGGMGSFSFLEGHFSHIIHAASQPSSSQDSIGYLDQFDANVQGTRRVLEFASLCGAKKFLFTSSGAVYGQQPGGLTHIQEDYAGAPDVLQPGTAYGQSKRISEFLCCAYARESGLQVLIARCFAFVGPHLPLDANYAIGNFIRDGLNGGPIMIKGDGTPIRSYLYAADLAVWLWTILFKGRSGQPYNVGSERIISIRSLAETVAQAFQPKPLIRILNNKDPNKPVEQYVPITRRAFNELQLNQNIGLEEAIVRTMSWAKGENSYL